METCLLHDVELGRAVNLERVLRMLLLGKQCGADVSDVACAFAEILAPNTESLPSTLAEAIDQETLAQCECDPVEIRILTRNGAETVSDCDKLIAMFRNQLHATGAAIKVATRRKLDLLRGGVTA